MRCERREVKPASRVQMSSENAGLPIMLFDRTSDGLSIACLAHQITCYAHGNRSLSQAESIYIRLNLRYACDTARECTIAGYEGTLAYHDCQSPKSERECSPPQYMLTVTGNYTDHRFHCGRSFHCGRNLATELAKAMHARGFFSSPEPKQVAFAKAGEGEIKHLVAANMLFKGDRAAAMGFQPKQASILTQIHEDLAEIEI